MQVGSAVVGDGCKTRGDPDYFDHMARGGAKII